MPDKPSMETFETGEGARIFRIPLEAFLGLWTYVHLVLFGPYRILIDWKPVFGRRAFGTVVELQMVKSRSKA